MYPSRRFRPQKNYKRILFFTITLCLFLLLPAIASGGKASKPVLLELHNKVSERLNFVIDIEEDVPQDIRDMLVSQTTDKSSPTKTGKLDLSGDQPTVLIYHTHATEAYTPTDQYSYVSTSEWRTDNATRSIIAVGEELARILRDDYGISVIHDTTDYEPPKLSTAYERSETGMLYYREQYPSIQLFIDIHRDAYETESGTSDYVLIDGVRTARMMFVVGTGENYDDKPNFDATFSLAEDLSNRLSAIDERLVRSIRVKTGRYNQHISDGCVLVEVGHNRNTLEEALNAVRLLAQVIAESANVPRTVSFIP